MARYEQKDHYYQKAKAQGRASRAVFKLEEFQERFGLFRQGDRVLDLGCAPGGWLQLVAEWVGGGGKVVGIDLQAIRVKLPPHVICLQGDIEDFIEQPEHLREKLGGLAQVVLSDMAPHTSGTRFVDQARLMALVDMAWTCAESLLAPGGHFVVKIFDGPDVPEFRRLLQSAFDKIISVSPKASRKGSIERYFVALQRK